MKFPAGGFAAGSRLLNHSLIGRLAPGALTRAFGFERRFSLAFRTFGLGELVDGQPDIPELGQEDRLVLVELLQARVCRQFKETERQ